MIKATFTYLSVNALFAYGYYLSGAPIGRCKQMVVTYAVAQAVSMTAALITFVRTTPRLYTQKEYDDAIHEVMRVEQAKAMRSAYYDGLSEARYRENK